MEQSSGAAALLAGRATLKLVEYWIEAGNRSTFSHAVQVQGVVDELPPGRLRTVLKTIVRHVRGEPESTMCTSLMTYGALLEEQGDTELAIDIYATIDRLADRLGEPSAKSQAQERIAFCSSHISRPPGETTS